MSHSSVSEIWERECRHGKHREREGGGGHGERERINRKTMKRQKERLKVCMQVGEKMRKRDGWMDGWRKSMGHNNEGSNPSPIL